MFPIKSSIIKKYLFSALILFFMPLIVLFTFYYLSRSNDIKVRVSEQRLSTVDQIKTKIDFLESDLSDIALETAYVFNMEDETDRVSSSGIIKNYENALDVLAKIIVYDRQETAVYTSAGKMSYYEFETSFGNAYDLTMVNLYSKLNSSTTPQIISTSPFSYEDPLQDNGLCFIYPLAQSTINTADSMAFLYDHKTMETLVKSFVGDIDASLFIFDAYLNPYYAVGIGDISDISVTESGFKQMTQYFGTGINTIEQDGGDLISIQTISEISGFTYCIVMTQDNFYSELSNFNFEFVLSVVFVIVCFVLLSTIFAYYNYNPFRKLFKNIDDEKLNGDEIDILNNIVYNNGRLEKKLKQVAPMVYNRCIEHILFSNKSEDQLHYYANCAGVQFTRDSFVSIYMQFVCKDTKNMGVDIDECILLIDDSRFSDADFHALEISSKPDSIALLCNFSKEKCDLIRIVSELKTRLENHWRKATFYIGIGSVCTMLNDCSLSFVKAQTALNMRDADEEIVVFTVKNNDEDSYPSVNMSLLLQSIQSGNINDSRLIFANMYNEMKSNCDSMLIFRYVSAEVLNNLIRFAKSHNLDTDARMVLSSISEQDYMEDFKRQAGNLVEQLTKNVKDNNDERDSEIKKQIVNDVLENYREYDICAESVAHSLNLSPRYVSKVISEETGYKFSGYVTYLRIEHAKKMLAETDCRIKDIVTEIGYVDDSSFIRKFKLHENMTPNEYRKLVRVSKD